MAWPCILVFSKHSNILSVRGPVPAPYQAERSLSRAGTGTDGLVANEPATTSRLQAAASTFDVERLAAPSRCCSVHHGTRGAAVLAMAPRDPDVPWVLVGRNGRNFPVPGDKHWQCRHCTDELPKRQAAMVQPSPP